MLLVITLSTSSENHINALEINNDIDQDENPVSIKSEFLISLFDQLLKSCDSRLGGSIVPFINEFPTDTELYRLMSTKINEQ